MNRIIHQLTANFDKVKISHKEGLFSAAYIARLKNTATLPTGKHRLSTCARYAYQCNSFQS